jgi:hypothetical protein
MADFCPFCAQTFSAGAASEKDLIAHVFAQHLWFTKAPGGQDVVFCWCDCILYDYRIFTLHLEEHGGLIPHFLAYQLEAHSG